MSALPRHGHTVGYKESPEYIAWKAMRARCERPSAISYRHYGERGIRVCPEWRASFEAFLRDMGLKPSPKHSLERLDRLGHYEPRNVVWATNYEQRRNLSTNRMLTIFGATRCLTDWASQAGIVPSTLSRRLAKGWSPAEAVTTPPEPGKRHGKPKQARRKPRNAALDGPNSGGAA